MNPTLDRKIEDVLLDIVDQLDAMVALWDLNQACVFANGAYLRWFGRTKREMLSGLTLQELLGPLYAQGLPYITEAYRGNTQVFERTLSTPEGIRHSLVTLAPYVVDGTVMGMSAHVVDVTSLKALQVDLQLERERLAAVLLATHAGAWEWNVQTGNVVVDERWAELIGYTPQELGPISASIWDRFLHPEDLQQRNELLERHFNGELEHYELEARLRHKDGQWIWVLDKGSVLSWTDDGKPLMMFGAHKNITVRKRREQTVVDLKDRFAALATTDELTGLLNRRGWEECVNQAESMAQRRNADICVMIVDLDDLKKINDTAGHRAGDTLIQHAARCLGGVLREHDRIARLGGDEFAILATDCSEETGQILLKRLEKQFAHEGINASWGLAPRTPATGVHGAAREADRRMYAMKSDRKANR